LEPPKKKPSYNDAGREFSSETTKHAKRKIGEERAFGRKLREKKGIGKCQEAKRGQGKGSRRVVDSENRREKKSKRTSPYGQEKKKQKHPEGIRKKGQNGTTTPHRTHGGRNPRSRSVTTKEKASRGSLRRSFRKQKEVIEKMPQRADMTPEEKKKVRICRWGARVRN